MEDPNDTPTPPAEPETIDPNPQAAAGDPDPQHNGPLTLTTEQHAEAKSLLDSLWQHLSAEGRSVWGELASVLRHR